VILRWSAKYGWADRVESWDEDQAKFVRQAHLDAIREMHARHSRIARAMLAEVEAALR
jgi:hypothetical protein